MLLFVNTGNLRIARENVGYTTLEATKKVCGRMETDKVKIWESGKAAPTWRQLKELANAYQINVFLLTSKEKIKPNRKIPDFRKGPTEAEEPDINTKKFIHFLLQRQEYLASVMKEEGLGKNKLVGAGHKIKTPQELAQFIAREIDYQYGGTKRGVTCLKHLVSLLEDKGVFIMKTLSYWPVRVASMRGVYLKDEYAPIIALNRKDAKTAQLFTLAHEIAHLFKNSEAISNIDFRDKTSNEMETFCNKVAANLLLPEKQIEERQYGPDDIRKLAKEAELSQLCVFYRLKNLGRLGEDSDAMQQKFMDNDREYGKEQKNKTDQSGGGNSINNMKDSNGYLFNNFISSLYFENKINAAEACKILKLSVNEV